jgi:GNAT superfamily N-acetyltransferase
MNQYDALLAGDVPQGNEYDALLADLAGQNEAKLKQATKQAQTTTPDKAAESRRIADRLKIPVEMVQRNPDLFKTQDTLDRLPYEDLILANPKLGQWLADPANAGVASDDVPGMQRIDQALTFLDSVKRGVDVGQSLFYGAAEATGELVGMEDLSAFGQAGRVRNLAEAEQYGQRSSFTAIRGPWDLTQWMKETIGEQIPMFAPIVAGAGAGAAVGSVVPGVGTAIGAAIGAFVPAFAMGVGEVEGAIKEKAPEAEAPGAAFIGGTAIAALDTILPGKIGSRIVRTFGFGVAEQVAARALAKPVQQRFIRRVAGSVAGGMATEGLTEAIQEAVGEIAAAAGTDTAVDWSQLAGQMLEAGAAGALVGGAAGVVPEPRVQAAQHGAQVLTGLGAAIQESKTAQRLPQAVESFIAQATKDGPVETVYAPVETWVTYWQGKGLDPATMASDVTGNAQAFETAAATGAKLPIPLSRYAAVLAGTEHNTFWAKELSLSPELMSERESQEWAKAQQAAPTESEQAPAESSVKASVLAQLEGAGVEPGVAEGYATLYESAFTNLAQRAGMTPEDLFGRYGLTVTREGLTPPAAQAQNVANAAPDRSDEAGRAPAGPVGTTPLRRVEASTPLGKESARATTKRRTEHYADVFSVVLDAARRIDPEVNPVQLYAEFNDRVRFLEDLQAEAESSGQNPRVLLEAIAKAGGIAVDAERGGGLTGELRWLRENAAGPYGNFAGVPNVFRKRKDTESGTREAGHSLDVMVQRLQQSPEFAYIETTDDLLAALDEISRQGDVGEKGRTFPGTQELAAGAGISLGERWWADDDSFDPSTFEQGPKATIRDLGKGTFVAEVNGEEVARANVADDGRGDHLVSVRVEPQYRRRGIATQLYAGIEAALGRPLKPSETQTPDGSAFWESRADLLDTGEQQPRLPGAEDVRDTELKTPTFELPFSLTPQTSKGKKGKQQTLFQPAYHGSPHIFDKFSLHKIGTGEGAQAYGWGLYFAGNKEVAEFYRRQLSIDKRKLEDLASPYKGESSDYAVAKLRQAARRASSEGRKIDALEYEETAR